MSESVYVLVQGRRPLGLEDENDSEYSATIRIAYDFLIKQNISKDNILLFTTSWYLDSFSGLNGPIIYNFKKFIWKVENGIKLTTLIWQAGEIYFYQIQLHLFKIQKILSIQKTRNKFLFTLFHMVALIKLGKFGK